MTQKEKDLLLKDLSCRLPYGVKLQFSHIITSPAILKGINEDFIECDIAACELEDVKPYLFPMSSMTEEQMNEYNSWKHVVPVCHYEYGDVVEELELFDSPESFEYLIENHFDYRGLIDRGLAIDCTNLNIY